jgi:hypothetical protein
MHRFFTTVAVAALVIGTPAVAQVQGQAQGQISNSASGAEANSGSISGAQSNNTANNNAGIGTSHNVNESTSNSGAVSGSASESTSNSNGNQQGQDQGQAQSANNTQGQNQSASSNQGQDQGQMQTQDQSLANANEQGVTVNQTWNTKNRRETEVRTNNAVPLASSSSFSSDYCGGSVSAGGSSAPLGISIGMAAPKFDKSCQALRRAEKFGMAAVNAVNMGQPELSGRLMSMMIWSICTSDSAGPGADRTTADACDKLLLLGSIRSAGSNVPTPAQAPEPRVARNGKVTPEAAYRAGSTATQDKVALAQTTAQTAAQGK